MANPPFNQDITDPADNAIVSQFPANERTFRDNVNSYLNIEHDINTGYHKFQILTTTAKTALVNPPAGMIVFDSTLSFLQINTGTSSVPVWTTIAGETTGVIKMWGPGAAPTGYLLLDGSAVSRTTYAALFTLYGTTFGVGDGSTTFNLPNFQRRVPVGAGGTTSGTLSNTVGSTGGEETHTLSQAELPNYNLPINDPTHTHPAPAGGQFVVFGSGGPVVQGTSSSTLQIAANTASSPTGITVPSGGSNTPHNTIQPSLVVNFIVKT